MSPISEFYGLFSAKAARDGQDVLTYSTPNGNAVQVTAILRSAEGEGYSWPDVVAVGPVVNLLSVQKGFHDFGVASSMSELWPEHVPQRRPRAGPGSIPQHTKPPRREWWQNR